MAIADAAALSMITDDALSPEVIELALDKLVAMLDGPAQNSAERRMTLTDALKKVARELKHLQDAVAAGEPPETLIAAIRERELRQKDIESQLRALNHAPALRAAAPQLRREAKALLNDWRGLLGRQVSTTRQLLRKLLDGERFVFHPQRQAEERWYELAVRPTLEKFFSAVPALNVRSKDLGNTFNSSS